MVTALGQNIVVTGHAEGDILKVWDGWLQRENMGDFDIVQIPKECGECPSRTQDAKHRCSWIASSSLRFEYLSHPSGWAFDQDQSAAQSN